MAIFHFPFGGCGLGTLDLGFCDLKVNQIPTQLFKMENDKRENRKLLMNLFCLTTSFGHCHVVWVRCPVIFTT